MVRRVCASWYSTPNNEAGSLYGSDFEPCLPSHLDFEPLAIGNPRDAAAGNLTFTTCDDIEGYIAEAEQRSGSQFLRAIRLPARECRHVLAELNLMGINAGSLFPGLDGACQQLRERFFD